MVRLITLREKTEFFSLGHVQHELGPRSIELKAAPVYVLRVSPLMIDIFGDESASAMQRCLAAEHLRSCAELGQVLDGVVEPKLHKEEATDEGSASQIRILSLVTVQLPVHACSILAVASDSKVNVTAVAMPVSPEGAARTTPESCDCCVR